MTVDTSVAPWEEAPENQTNELSEFEEFGDSNAEFDDAPIPPEKEPLIEEIAAEFVGSWNALVSQTNWEKGKVIHTWRTRLQEAGLPRRVYSDEAISQRIGQITPQHVGRLRRVYERFGDKPMLPNLYWSHYKTALDWDDADEWLEKASKEKLSIAQTQLARFEKLGITLKSEPVDENETTDEAFDYGADSNAQEPVRPKEVDTAKDDSKDEKKKKSKPKKENDLGEYAGASEPWEQGGSVVTFTTADVLDAISKLEPLPADFEEAIESIKVAILTRKLEKWTDVQPVQIAAYLSELKRLLVAEEN